MAKSNSPNLSLELVIKKLAGQVLQTQVDLWDLHKFSLSCSIFTDDFYLYLVNKVADLSLIVFAQVEHSEGDGLVCCFERAELLESVCKLVCSDVIFSN